jgi:hypothetical protein
MIFGNLIVPRTGISPVTRARELGLNIYRLTRLKLKSTDSAVYCDP